MVVRLNLGILRFANLHTGLGGLYYEPAYLLTVFDGQWIWGQCLKGIFSKGVFVCQDMLISQPKWLWQWWSWMLNGSVYGGVDLVIVIVATILMILTMFVMVEDEKSEYALVFHHELSRITYVCIFIYIYRIILYIYIFRFLFSHLASCLLWTLQPQCLQKSKDASTCSDVLQRRLEEQIFVCLEEGEIVEVCCRFLGMPKPFKTVGKC